MTALMYHDIVPPGADDESGFLGRDAARYKITPALFDAHLEAIAETSRASAGARTVLITFDDGGISAMRAADALERRGFTGHFFVTVNYIGTRGFLARADIAELRRRGHVIGSHSCSHPLRMAHCAPGQLTDEWTRSRAALEEIVGEDVRVASVPGGDFAPRVAAAAAAAGYTQLFTSEPARTSRQLRGLTLIGRFAIQRWTTAGSAAALAGGAWLPCARQTIFWQAKKIAKRVTGGRYLQLRQRLLGHGNDVQWGDRPA